MTNLWDELKRVVGLAWFQAAGGLVLILVGVLFSDIPTMISSLTWPSVDGVITSRRLVAQKFEEYDGDDYMRIEGYLHYEYTVDGTTYSASSVDALDLVSYPEETARKYDSGLKVEVFYNPRDPAQAVLEPGMVLSPQAFGLLPSAAVIAGALFLLRGLWQRRTGHSSLLRGWPDDHQSGTGIGAGVGRM